MNPFVLFALIASLALNGFFAFRIQQTRSIHQPADPMKPASNNVILERMIPSLEGAGQIAGEASIQNLPFKDPALADPRAVAAKMKREGYADWAILNAVTGAFLERNNNEFAWLEQLSNQKWVQGSTEAKAAFAKLDKELAALLADISSDLPNSAFNPEFLPKLREQQRQLNYGDLAPEKVGLVQAIEGEYNANSTSRRGPLSPADEIQNWATVAARIKNVLTPEEAEDYFRYNTTLMGSPTSQVQSVLQELVVDQNTYVTLADQANALARQVPGSQLMRILAPKFQEVLSPGDFEKISNKLISGVSGFWFGAPSPK